MYKVIPVLFFLFLFFSCNTTGGSGRDAQSSAQNTQTPVWIDNPRSVYPEAQFVAASGWGKDKTEAEKSALGNLISIFGQKVSGNTTVISSYKEVLSGGVLTVSEDSSLNRAVSTSFDLDTVVGAKIMEVWTAPNGTVHAVAAMEKARAIPLYSELIDSNEQTISKLLAISSEDRNTLDSYARHDLAGALADSNGRFVNVLSVLSPSAAAAKRSFLSNGDQIRLECLRIAQAIPISVEIENDKEGRIAAAFTSVVSSSGFKSGGTDSRYKIVGNLMLSPVDLPTNPNKFVRYVLDAKLIDSKLMTELVPYSINGREGHSSFSEAENRAVRMAEQKIRQEYAYAFASYLQKLTVK